MWHLLQENAVDRRDLSIAHADAGIEFAICDAGYNIARGSVTKFEIKVGLTGQYPIHQPVERQELVAKQPRDDGEFDRRGDLSIGTLGVSQNVVRHL